MLSPSGEGEWCGSRDRNLVTEKRQKIQLKLAFPEENEGEAFQDSGEGTHAVAAKTNSHDPVKLVNLMEEILDKQNLNRAYSQILSNKGARTPGVDGMTVPQLKAYVQKHWPNGLVQATEEGTPQGGPLSPLLSNIVLDELDLELERRGHCFVRYADDCNIYVRSRRAAERTLASVSHFVERKLRLKVNREKSAVDRPWRRKFLGFSFTNHRQPRRRIAPASLDRFKQRIRELTRRTRGTALENVIGELTRYLRGWLGYFGFCETQSVLRDLESWLHRRLRALMWKRWKRGTVRFRELRARGVSHDLAAQSAGSSHNVWRLSRSPALNIALPGKFWKSLGLPSLTTKAP